MVGIIHHKYPSPLKIALSIFCFDPVKLLISQANPRSSIFPSSPIITNDNCTMTKTPRSESSVSVDNYVGNGGTFYLEYGLI